MPGKELGARPPAYLGADLVQQILSAPSGSYFSAPRRTGKTTGLALVALDRALRGERVAVVTASDALLSNFFDLLQRELYRTDAGRGSVQRVTRRPYGLILRGPGRIFGWHRAPQLQAGSAPPDTILLYEPELFSADLRAALGSLPLEAAFLLAAGTRRPPETVVRDRRGSLAPRGATFSRMDRIDLFSGAAFPTSAPFSK